VNAVANLAVDHQKCIRCDACIAACPFGAIQIADERIAITAACRVCKLCLKACPAGAITLSETRRASVNKDEWRGVLVFVEHLDGAIHPVTLELIGKARELAAEVGFPVYALFLGAGIAAKAAELLLYGVDKVFVYDEEQLRHFRVDVYANAFADCINRVKPSIVLVGATSIGRSLAPRVATRFRTGLTADCTKLAIKPNTDLVQIRPAFGGNIMAQIITTHTRPQFATVRYKVMNTAGCVPAPTGTVESLTLDPTELQSRIRVLKVERKEQQPSISEAEVLVAAGRGVKDPKDLALLEELAVLLGGQLAVSRPLVEAGWAHYTRQIGLSGRTVKPKLIITCGISGAVQFTACMNAAERIVAINTDPGAPIFKIAHYGVVGDWYQIVPALIERIKKEGPATCVSITG
jgi:electron transfer flavoprotein alpha subunit